MLPFIGMKSPDTRFDRPAFSDSELFKRTRMSPKNRTMQQKTIRP